MLKISAFLFNTSVDSRIRMHHPRHSVAETLSRVSGDRT